eukprot:753824-Hanusia_phi.AAC.3
MTDASKKDFKDAVLCNENGNSDVEGRKRKRVEGEAGDTDKGNDENAKSQRRLSSAKPKEASIPNQGEHNSDEDELSRDLAKGVRNEEHTVRGEQESIVGHAAQEGNAVLLSVTRSFMYTDAASDSALLKSERILSTTVKTEMDEGAATESQNNNLDGSCQHSESGEAQISEFQGEVDATTSSLGLHRRIEEHLQKLPFSADTDLGQIVIYSFGAIVFDVEGYWNADHIFPIGYTGIHTIATAQEDPSKISFLFEIRYDGAGLGNTPLFVVSEQSSSQEFSSNDADKAWRQALGETNAKFPWQPGAIPSGPALFGLTCERVRERISTMPGSDLCHVGSSLHRARRSAFLEASRSLKDAKKGKEADSRKGREAEGQEQRSKKKESKEERNRRKEEAKKDKIMERERLRKERLKQKQQEKDQLNEIKEKQKLEAQKRKDQEKEIVKDLREKRQAEIEKAKEERRVAVENYREMEKKIREQQRLAKVLELRQSVMEDLELMNLRKFENPEDCKPIKDWSEQIYVNPADKKDILEAESPCSILPEQHTSAIIEVWEFVNMFSERLCCKKLPWAEFTNAIMDDRCLVFHGLHVHLVNMIFHDLPAADHPFRGRPLNSLTWPELFRQYLLMVRQEYRDEELDELASKLRLREMQVALEHERYEDLSLDTRILLLSFNVQLVMETHTIRNMIDERIEKHAALQYEKRQEFYQLARDSREGKSTFGDRKDDLPLHTIEEVESAVMELQDILTEYVNDPQGPYGPGMWPSVSPEADEVIRASARILLGSLASGECSFKSCDAIRRSYIHDLSSRMVNSVEKNGNRWHDEWKTLLNNALDQVLGTQPSSRLPEIFENLANFLEPEPTESEYVDKNESEGTERMHVGGKTVYGMSEQNATAEDDEGDEAGDDDDEYDEDSEESDDAHDNDEEADHDDDDDDDDDDAEDNQHNEDEDEDGNDDDADEDDDEDDERDGDGKEGWNEPKKHLKRGIPQVDGLDIFESLPQVDGAEDEGSSFHIGSDDQESSFSNRDSPVGMEVIEITSQSHGKKGSSGSSSKPSHSKKNDGKVSEASKAKKGGEPSEKKPTKKSSQKQPAGPKRPQPAFFHYCNAVRDQVKLENPSCSFGELSKLIGKRWSELPPEAKVKYVDMEEKDRERYSAAMKSTMLGASPPAMSMAKSAQKSAKESEVREDTLMTLEDDSESDTSSPSANQDVSESEHRNKVGSVGSDTKNSKGSSVRITVIPMRKASMNASSRKGASRKIKKGEDPLDWIQCDSCNTWRFFYPGLVPNTVTEAWNCKQAKRECGQLRMEEEFMKDWTDMMKNDNQATCYKFILEGVTFVVFELYWSVISLGGSSAVSKWKDVGNDMMWRKQGVLVSKTPGKNYGLIKNQWERWQLSKFEELYSSKPVPEEYLAPAVDPKRKDKDREAVPTHSPLNVEAPNSSSKKDAPWKGRKMWPRKEISFPAETGSPVPFESTSPIPTIESPVIQAQLPPLPVYNPLPPLPELTYDDKLHLRMNESISFTRGLRVDGEVSVKKANDVIWRTRLEAVKLRNEPLGQDRFFNRYWVLNDDFSKIWVQRVNSEHGLEASWGLYSTVEEVEKLIGLLDPHGMRENNLKEVRPARTLLLAADRFAVSGGVQG